MMNLKFGNFDDPLTPVESQLPTVNSASRICIIAAWPSADDIQFGKPLYDNSSKVFRAILQQHGISPLQVMISYCCRYRPARGAIKNLAYNSFEIKDSHKQLRKELDEFKPNVILLLGTYSLSVAGIHHSVDSYRGSRFICSDNSSPFFGYKCIATYDPMQVQKKYDLAPLQSLDIGRLKDESKDPTLTLPSKECKVDLTAKQTVTLLDAIPDGSHIALDIEGYINKMTCCSVKVRGEITFIVDFTSYDRIGEGRIWQAFGRVMSNHTISKVLQNGMYDMFVLAWSYGIVVRNVSDDTMLSGWEIYPELPKSLAVQTSIWTGFQYYKSDRKINDLGTHHRYCCTDSLVTLEISDTQKQFMQDDKPALAHYEFNVRLLNVLMYMQMRGMRFDQAQADEFLGKVKHQMHEVQLRLDQRAGKKLNVNSPVQMCNFLYNHLLLPVVHPKIGNKYDRTKRTSGIDACLSLFKKFQDPALTDILVWRKLEKLRQQLEIQTDADGRVRGSYNIVGTKTGRLSAAKSATGNGANLQTITKAVRKCFRADPGYELFQLDLAGADGWTVAAHCARHGDNTMLLDYQAGIKPAKVIALMYRHGQQIAQLSRDELVIRCKEVSEQGDLGWQYAASKAVQHGTNYMMGAPTVADTILKGSYKNTGRPVYVPIPECKRLQALYLQRYPGVTKWHSWVDNRIRTRGQLTAASGCTRRFFGRPNDKVTLRDALSHEPQANTTYATNLAMEALYYDPENRREDGRFIIEPLHQVHDAVVGQWPKEVRDWAIKKLYGYFDNEMLIADTKMVIPFDGEYGRSWGEIYNEM